MGSQLEKELIDIPSKKVVWPPEMIGVLVKIFYIADYYEEDSRVNEYLRKLEDFVDGKKEQYNQYTTLIKELSSISSKGAKESAEKAKENFEKWMESFKPGTPEYNYMLSCYTIALDQANSYHKAIKRGIDRIKGLDSVFRANLKEIKSEKERNMKWVDAFIDIKHGGGQYRLIPAIIAGMVDYAITNDFNSALMSALGGYLFAEGLVQLIGKLIVSRIKKHSVHRKFEVTKEYEEEVSKIIDLNLDEIREIYIHAETFAHIAYKKYINEDYTPEGFISEIFEALDSNTYEKLKRLKHNMQISEN